MKALDDQGTAVSVRDYRSSECVLCAVPSGTVRTRVRWGYGAAFSPDGQWWIRMRRPFRNEDPWVHIQSTTTGEEHDVTDRWLDAQGQVWIDTRSFADEEHLTPEERARRRVQDREGDPNYETVLDQHIDVERRKQAHVAAHWASPKPLFIDAPDSIVTRPVEGKRFEVFVGCYGFVWRCLVAPGPRGHLERVRSPGSDLVFSDVVYDPVALLAPAGTHYVLARHGYGSGLLAMDSRRRLSYAFPANEVVEKQGYGCIAAGVAGVGTDVCAVQAREGSFLWRPGTTPVALPDSMGDVLAVWDRVLLASDPEGQTLTWYRWRLDS